MNFSKEKMKEVIHYIIGKCEHKTNFGRTVLYKLLYFSDFDYFELNKKAITNETYEKYPYGPLPIHFDEVKEELVDEKKIIETESDIFPGSIHTKFKYKSLTSPAINLLNNDELERIDETIKLLSNKTAGEISDYSHDDIPWRATEDKEVIDYYYVFYRNPPYSIRELNV
jgi:uncharacterized phage-associated protein